MAVYAPGDSPPDPNSIAQDPGMWARLMGYVNPIGSAQAAEAPRGPASSGTAAPGVQYGGHPANQYGQPIYGLDALKSAINSGPGNTNTPAILPHLTGDGPNVQGRPILPYLNPNTRELANAAAIPTDLPPPAPGNPTPWFTPSNTPLPWRGPDATPATTAPLPPSRPAAIDPRMTGVVPPSATAQAPSSMFTTFDRPNMNPGTGGGMLGGALASPRGTGGPSQMGMLDLSGLFGGGGQASAPASSTLPRKKINVGKIPDNARAEVPPDTTSKAPSDYGPLQRNRRWKMENPDLYR
jgi:hypothetical protein